MADLSEQERIVRELLLQRHPAVMSLGDAMIDDLVRGKKPTADGGGPALKMNLWPLIDEAIKWLPYFSALVSSVSGALNIVKALSSDKKPNAAQIADEVVKDLTEKGMVKEYDRESVMNAVEVALDVSYGPTAVSPNDQPSRV